ncbi:hypothetical protein EGW08_007658 [Elysia chlorotica]|uniref:Uncharacterized protein n=1 Tax=Elysia chlorotica TaxID=188477 RepID=A0A3S0ZQQ9_ELYCH|nr:hypothetical protein EGW08_007658 [Elysia chlorotica]
MCGPSSGWSKLALVVLIVGVALHIGGWATINWMSYSTTNGVVDTDIGLWRMKSCTSGTCSETSVASVYETGKVQLEYEAGKVELEYETGKVELEYETGIVQSEYETYKVHSEYETHNYGTIGV